MALASFRTCFALSKAQLAERLEVNAKLITLVENNEQEADQTILQRYATLFGVPVNDFHALATALERSVPKFGTDGTLHDNHRKNAERALKACRDFTRLVFNRELALIEFTSK